MATALLQSADEVDRPITCAEWAAASKYQSDTCQEGKLGFSAAKAAPFRTYEFSQMSESPLFSFFSSPSLHLPSHSFHSRVAGEEGGAPSALSDESDNRQRCFGSGDTALAKHFVCASVCVLGGKRGVEKSDERLKVTDVSRPTIGGRDKQPSCPADVHTHPSGEPFKVEAAPFEELKTDLK